MSEDNKLEQMAESLAEQLQAGHRSRMNMNNVLFHEVQPDESFLPKKEQIQEPLEETQGPMRSADSTVPESYLNYAAQLLEQMRGVYSTSWDSCSNGNTWHGGHNHFYNPCSGADVAPQNHNCPVYDNLHILHQAAAVQEPQLRIMMIAHIIYKKFRTS